MTDTVRLPIDGMTCTSCVAHITKAVRKVEGVEHVKVDLGSDSATVAFDPDRTSLTEIGWAIREAGYEPRVGEAEPVAAGTPRRGLVTRLLSRWNPAS